MKEKETDFTELAAEMYSKIGAFDLRYLQRSGHPRWVVLVSIGAVITRLSGEDCTTPEQALRAAARSYDEQFNHLESPAT